jgi:hypothetical protein
MKQKTRKKYSRYLKRGGSNRPAKRPAQGSSSSIPRKRKKLNTVMSRKIINKSNKVYKQQTKTKSTRVTPSMLKNIPSFIADLINSAVKSFVEKIERTGESYPELGLAVGDCDPFPNARRLTIQLFSCIRPCLGFIFWEVIIAFITIILRQIKHQGSHKLYYAITAMKVFPILLPMESLPSGTSHVLHIRKEPSDFNQVCKEIYDEIEETSTSLNLWRDFNTPIAAKAVSNFESKLHNLNESIKEYIKENKQLIIAQPRARGRHNQVGGSSVSNKSTFTPQEIKLLNELDKIISKCSCPIKYGKFKYSKKKKKKKKK